MLHALGLSSSRIGHHHERIAPISLTRNAVLQQPSSSPEFITKTVAKSATERWRKYDPLDSTYGVSRIDFACQWQSV
jgi:hypothetical protein